MKPFADLFFSLVVMLKICQTSLKYLHWK